MKAVVWHGDERFSVEDVPQPVARYGQVIVQVEAAAVCGSDYHLADFGATPPLIPGHEAAGTVVSVADGATGVRVGQRVALDPVQRCGECWCCRHSVPHLCTNCRHLGDRQTPGAWAQFVAIDAANAHPLPDNVGFAAGSLTEPAAVCYESFQRAGLRKGDCVLIIGDGPFGFLHAQLARTLGAGKIVLAGHYDERLERIVRATGAVGCNTHRQALSSVLAQEMGAPGVDIAIEATGCAASAIAGIEALRPRGTIVLFSYVWQPQPLPMGRIHMREINLLGSCRSLAGYGPCLDLMGKGRINTAALLDIQAPLADCSDIISRLKSDKRHVFKAVFRPQG